MFWNNFSLSYFLLGKLSDFSGFFGWLGKWAIVAVFFFSVLFFFLSFYSPSLGTLEGEFMAFFFSLPGSGRERERKISINGRKIGIDSFSLEKNTCVLCLIYFNNGTVSLFFVLALLWGWERFGNCFSGEEWMRFSFSSCSNVSIWK